jgi:hypothetical protein
MADPDPQPLRRRFVTRVDVEDAARDGQSITLGPHDVITHEAAARAADLGVPVERPQRPQPPTWTGVAPRPSIVEPLPPRPADPSSGGREQLRHAVRAAIVAELGSEPPGLDQAIDRVLARRER